jgi:hypothetical protein
MVRVDAAAAQLHHPLAQAPKPREVELRVAVGAAHAHRLHRRQHAVGADHLERPRIAHEQVLAIVVEQVHVMACDPAVQAGAHLRRENLVPQSLRLAHFVLVPGPGDQDATAFLRNVLTRAMK